MLYTLGNWLFCYYLGVGMGTRAFGEKLRELREQSGITQKELAARTKINRLTVRNNTKFLIDKELLSAVKIGKEIHHFFVSPEELERTKMMRLITKFLLDKIDEETYWDLRNALVA